MNKETDGMFFEQIGSAEEAMEVIGRLFDVTKPDAVYAEPVEVGNYTVITASELVVTVGAGYGGGCGSDPTRSTGENGEPAVGSGGGGGGGGIATGRPVAAITIGPEGTKVDPIIDPTKIAIAFFTTFTAMIITIMQALRFMGRKKLK